MTPEDAERKNARASWHVDPNVPELAGDRASYIAGWLARASLAREPVPVEAIECALVYLQDAATESHFQSAQDYAKGNTENGELYETNARALDKHIASLSAMLETRQ